MKHILFLFINGACQLFNINLEKRDFKMKCSKHFNQSNKNRYRDFYCVHTEPKVHFWGVCDFKWSQKSNNYIRLNALTWRFIYKCEKCFCFTDTFVHSLRLTQTAKPVQRVVKTYDQTIYFCPFFLAQSFIVFVKRLNSGLHFFFLRTDIDSQQQPSTCTSCAGGEPGPDSSLARDRTTSSALLRLHCDEVCLEKSRLRIPWKQWLSQLDCERA